MPSTLVAPSAGCRCARPSGAAANHRQQQLRVGPRVVPCPTPLATALTIMASPPRQCWACSSSSSNSRGNRQQQQQRQQAAALPTTLLRHGQELDDAFTGLDGGTGVMTVAGFGSLLSERSARTTFPELQNFRAGRLYGFRRVFAHTADIFFQRGIANAATGEIASLSCERAPTTTSSSSSSDDSDDSRAGPSLVVSLFEVAHTPANVAAFIAREHEFRFLAVQAWDLAGRQREPQLAVLCGANTDEHYRATRCPPDEWARRWGCWGIERVWRDDVLPCRVYLRHCVLAAAGFSREAHDSFLDATFLADRVTSVRSYLESHPGILGELPPPELAGRYSG